MKLNNEPKCPICEGDYFNQQVLATGSATWNGYSWEIDTCDILDNYEPTGGITCGTCGEEFNEDDESLFEGGND